MKKPKLFLLHFAGGNCYSFQFLMPYLKDFEVVVPELPGRGQRMSEELILDFGLAAKDIYRQIFSRLDDQPFVIYGHSLGAYLALKVTEMLALSGKKPVGIVVSGNAGPGMDKSRKRYLLERADFIQELRNLGGVPEEVIQNKEMFDFFEPVLRADFRLAAHEETALINVPIYALMGSEESQIEKISNWANFTSAPFDAQIWEGDHFFIHQHPQKLGAVIKTFYQQHQFSTQSEKKG